MLHYLPKTSLVSFCVPKIPNAQAVWKNNAIHEGIDLNDYTFALPIGDEREHLFDQESLREFSAERYGGGGMTANGGGARCGWDGKVQVKGIGRNPLAGSDSEYSHSYGGESLAWGVREAIWGEVCASVLPYGAVRVIGLIDTGTRVPSFTPDGLDVRRGLTVREAALRPAHFVRALTFSRRDEEKTNLMLDAERTRAAVGRLPQIFRDMLPAIESDLETKRINAGLAEMTRRWAVQHSAAFSKRLVHGAYSASNLSIDGRWLDFGTASSVSDFGRILLARNGYDPWDYQIFGIVIADLVHNLRRYGPPAAARDIVTHRELYDHFVDTVNTSLTIDFAKLSGVPEWACKALPPHLTSNLFCSIKEIISTGNKEPFKFYQPCPHRLPQMPETMGTYNLGQILATISLTKCTAEAEQALGPLLPSELRTPFISAYWSLREQYLAMAHGRAQVHAEPFMILNALRLNLPTPELYRHVLNEEIAKHVESGGNIADFISSRVSSTVAARADSKADQIEVSGRRGKPIIFCASRGLAYDNELIPYHIRPLSDLSYPTYNISSVLRYAH